MADPRAYVTVAREATAEFGERYLEVVTNATVRMLDDIARTHEALPPR